MENASDIRYATHCHMTALKRNTHRKDQSTPTVSIKECIKSPSLVNNKHDVFAQIQPQNPDSTTKLRIAPSKCISRLAQAIFSRHRIRLKTMAYRAVLVRGGGLQPQLNTPSVSQTRTGTGCTNHLFKDTGDRQKGVTV